MAKRKQVKKKPFIKDIAVATLAGGTAYGVARIPLPTLNKRLAVIQRANRRAESKLGARLAEEFITEPRRNSWMLSRKDIFPFMFNKDAVTTYPASFVKGRIRKASSLKARIQGGVSEKFIIKKSNEAMSKPGSFIDETNFNRRKAQVAKVLKNPDAYVIQPKIPIKAEYRVTSTAGKVTSITHRRIPGVTSPIGAVVPVINPKTRKDLTKFVERAWRRSAMKRSAVSSGMIGNAWYYN